MKNLSLVVIIALSSIFGFAQCDENAIFNNTTTNAVCTEVDGAVRYFYANSLPDHTTGTFPNANNPNAISAQQLSLTMCAYPKQAGSTTYLDQGSGNCPFWEFGIAVNGIEFDPIANEFFTNTSNGQQNTDWNENALSSHINLGLDMNDAHVQPTGKYHYHGDPAGLVTNLGITSNAHSPIIGYAGDGYPIYYRYVYSDPLDSTSGIIDIASCYQLKSGNRPGDGVSAPDGAYDGTYTQDYEYVSGGNCSLDECNGRYGFTPDYPNGTYYYVLTADFPVIPRCFKGNPDKAFTIGPTFQGCATSSANQICSLPTSINDRIDQLERMLVFPNPVTEHIPLDIDASLRSHVTLISVINSVGKTVLEANTNASSIDVSRLPSGNYFLHVESGTESITKKFIKN